MATFQFKRFSVRQEGATHPVGTDGVLLGAWVNVRDAGRILDIGTGSGLVALMLAQRTEHLSQVSVTAVEIHPESCVCAAQNFQNSPWRERLTVVETAVQNFESPRPFDLIVSNPPFFSETILSPDATRRLARHAGALPAAEMLLTAERLLAPAGKLCVILPLSAGRHLSEAGCLRGLYCTRETEVYARPEKPLERLLLQFERDPRPYEKTRLAIYRSGNELSEEYRDLTRDFYL